MAIEVVLCVSFVMLDRLYLIRLHLIQHRSLLLLHQDLAPGNLRYQQVRGRCVLERLEKLRVYLQCLVEQGFLYAMHVEQL